MDVSVFFFNDTATTEIYTLSLHDALPIYGSGSALARAGRRRRRDRGRNRRAGAVVDDDESSILLDHSEAALRRVHRLLPRRSEEHTSELQSRQYLVCRLLLEKKKFI